MLHKCDLNYRKGAIISESTHVSIYTCCTLFSSLNSLLVSLFSVFVGILFCKAKGQWSCGQGSVFPDFNLCLGTSFTSSCFRLTPPKIKMISSFSISLAVSTRQVTHIMTLQRSPEIISNSYMITPSSGAEPKHKLGYSDSNSTTEITCFVILL